MSTLGWRVVIGWTGVRGVKAFHLSDNYGMPTKLNHFSPPGVMNTGTSNPYLSPPPSTRARWILPLPAVPEYEYPQSGEWIAPE